jgi:hypothetical protein
MKVQNGFTAFTPKSIHSTWRLKLTCTGLVNASMACQFVASLSS